MKDEKLTVYGMYMTKLAASVIKNTAPPMPFDGIDWDKLYKLADAHNVAVLIFPAIKKLDVAEDVYKKFESSYHRCMAREARQEIELLRVSGIFDSEEIDHIKLKGSYIKNFYPAPYMRTSSDVDLCVRQNDRKRAGEKLCELGYILDETTDYHDEYVKDNFFIYEIHSSLMSSSSEFYEIFDEPFKKSIKDNSGKNAYVLNDEYQYLHLLFHLHKHFSSEGCGIRLFCDLYIFERTHKALDFEMINNTLDKYGLKKFRLSLRELMDCFFENAELEKKYYTVTDFIFSSGEYGIPDLKKIKFLSKDNNANIHTSDKLRRIRKMVFPSIKDMSTRYPRVARVPILLPLYWVKRWFDVILFRRKSFDTVNRELKEMNTKYIATAQEVHEIMGSYEK